MKGEVFQEYYTTHIVFLLTWLEENKTYKINVKGRKTRKVMPLKQISEKRSVQSPEMDTIPATARANCAQSPGASPNGGLLAQLLQTGTSICEIGQTLRHTGGVHIIIMENL